MSSTESSGILLDSHFSKRNIVPGEIITTRKKSRPTRKQKNTMMMVDTADVL